MKIEATHTTWMGEVPEHWEVKALKFCADLITKRVDGSEVQGEYVGLEHIESKTGKFVRLEGSQESAESTVSCYCNGDVLFGKLRPYLAKAAVAESEGVCSSEILVYRPHAMDPHYLKHVMLLEGFIEEVNASTYGSKMPRADSAFISRLPVPVPPMQEQIEIAKYLDIETNRIDFLIGEKERLLGLLSELRGSFIRERTMGLDLEGPRKRTGNVFMPSIPSDWGLAGMGRYTKTGNGSTPLKDNADYWEGGYYPWLNSSVVNRYEVNEGSELVTDLALKQCHLPIVPAGSVLIALTGQGKTRGQATMLRIEATINQHLAFLTPDEQWLDSEYLYWFLEGQFESLRMISDGQGGTKGALTCDDLKQFQIPLPMVHVQKEIAAQLYRDTGKVDALTGHVNLEIKTLHELRQATITDAVLGRIDVRDVRASLK